MLGRILETAHTARTRQRLCAAFQRPGVGILKTGPGDEVRVVDDDMRVRDAALVVIVVDEGDLVVAEVLARPGEVFCFNVN